MGNISTNLAMVAAKALPSIASQSFTYNKEKNLFIENGYTSRSGNTYYRVALVSDKLAIFLSIGEGWYRTFLNGITIMGFDGRNTRVIADERWGGSNWRKFNLGVAKAESARMLGGFLENQARALGAKASREEIMSMAQGLIAETERKLIA